MSFIRLLVVAAAFSSGEALTPGVHAPAVRRVAAVSPVVPTVMMVRASLLRSVPPCCVGAHSPVPALHSLGPCAHAG